jgi:hypothetical protein
VSATLDRVWLESAASMRATNAAERDLLQRRLED